MFISLIASSITTIAAFVSVRSSKPAVTTAESCVPPLDPMSADLIELMVTEIWFADAVPDPT